MRTRTNPAFGDFLDGVINNRGIAATAAFLNSGGMEVFTGAGRWITARTNPSSPFFTNIDNVSVNDSGDVAFFANEVTGGQGVFIETTGGAAPAAVVEAGDVLFGSTVTGLSTGRFSLNNRDEVVFQYTLADGRSGIAIAVPQRKQGR